LRFDRTLLVGSGRCFSLQSSDSGADSHAVSNPDGKQ